MLAYGIGGALAAAGVVLSFLYTGSALATTAIGTLIPILRDGGELQTRFGTYLLAAGAVGEFGPILLITLVLSTTQPLHEALDAGRVHRARPGRWRWPRCGSPGAASARSSARSSRAASSRSGSRPCSSSDSSLLASELGLDLLLGGFVAGMIVRAALRGREVEVFESKLTAVGFGFLIPFFFVESGINFDLDALGSAEAIAKLFLFLGLFLVVRGAPALLLYRGVLDARDRAALAFFSATELPLVVAITTLAIESGRDDVLDRGGAGRRGDALDPDLPLRRHGAAPGQARDEREPEPELSPGPRRPARPLDLRAPALGREPALARGGASPWSPGGACAAAARRRSAPAAARPRARGCAPGCARPGRSR